MCICMENQASLKYLQEIYILYNNVKNLSYVQNKVIDNS